jgi:hypothetical protein
MRTLIISDTADTEIGTITENDSGTLTAEGKGQTLLEQAPGKTFDDWLENGHHSKYLRYTEKAA